MPSTAIYDFTNVKLEPAMAPDLARTISVLLKPSTTFVKGTILGEITASPGVYTNYDHTQNDGTQVPKGILAYDVVTDAAGNPTGLTYPYPPWPDLGVPMYVKGFFNSADIWSATELAQALTVAGWGALVQGNATTGVFRMG